MTVELIAYSQSVDSSEDKNPLNIVEKAASVCYNSMPTDTYKIAKGCKATKHLSVLEHISFTFHINGVSRALLAQLSRHRHVSLSVRSQRYVPENNFDYVNPFASDDAEVFDGMMADIANNYRILKEYHNATNEDARAVLPNSCCTELYMTANARALIEMSHLRLCNRAQAEIRAMFAEIKKQIATVCPEVASWMVPSCEMNPKYPFCPEGNRCCGRHPRLADVYITKEKQEALYGNKE